MESPSIYDLQTNTMNVAAGSFGSVPPPRMQSPHHVQQSQSFTRPQYPSESTSMRSMTPGTTSGSLPMYGLQEGNYSQTAMPRYSSQGIDASSLSQYPQASSPYAIPMQQQQHLQQYGQHSPYVSFTTAPSMPSSYFTSQPGYGMDGQGPNGSQYTSRSRPP